MNPKIFKYFSFAPNQAAVKKFVSEFQVFLNAHRWQAGTINMECTIEEESIGFFFMAGVDDEGGEQLTGSVTIFDESQERTPDKITENINANLCSRYPVYYMCYDKSELGEIFIYVYDKNT